MYIRCGGVNQNVAYRCVNFKWSCSTSSIHLKIPTPCGRLAVNLPQGCIFLTISANGSKLIRAIWEMYYSVKFIIFIGIPEVIVNAISVLYNNSNRVLSWWMETSQTHSKLLLVCYRGMFWHHSCSLYSLTTWWQKQLRTLILVWSLIFVSLGDTQLKS